MSWVFFKSGGLGGSGFSVSAQSDNFEILTYLAPGQNFKRCEEVVNSELRHFYWLFWNPREILHQKTLVEQDFFNILFSWDSLVNKSKMSAIVTSKSFM